MKPARTMLASLAALAVLAAAALIAGGAVACGPTGSASSGESVAGGGEVSQGAAQPARGRLTQGTITARLDGRERTWFVISEDSTDPTRSAGVWLPSWVEEHPEDRMVAIGGFDTENAPLGSFRRDPRANIVDYGDYDGSLLLILIQIRSGASSMRVRFPDASPGIHAVIYMPKASPDDLTQFYMPREAAVDVTSVSFDHGRAAMAGTFSGRFGAMQGSGAVTMEDGRFSVRGMPKFEGLQ